jgi:8-oxo-dGTP pyrophosphatase MutT (NUDIX family)
MVINIFRKEQSFILKEKSGEPCDKLWLKQHFNIFVQSDSPKNFEYACENIKKAIAYIKEQVECRQAAGGLVLNKYSELLLIERFGKSDFPKGHIDAGETKQETALREVAEESSIVPHRIIRELAPSYHIFYLDENRPVLKEVFWFLMHYEGDKTPVPQSSEDITRAEWVSKSELHKRYHSFFPNLKYLADYFLSL